MLQADWARQRLAGLGIRPDEFLDEVRLLTPEGRLFGGADAVLWLARQLWWAVPLSLFGRIPGVRRLLRAAYRQAAERR